MPITKVYWAPGNYLEGPQLRLNPGEAKDLNGAAEYELQHDGNLLEYLKNRTYARAHRVFSNEHNLPWALSEEEAHRIADEAGVPHDNERRVMTAEIRAPYLKPMTFPVEKTLFQNDRGLYCRLNIHPEIDGSYNVPGKLFFPDKTCADKLCEGPCVITDIKDKGNYGFFTGHMKQFSAPTETALDAYIRETHIHMCSLQYMSGKFGTYINLILRPDTWSHGYAHMGRVLVQSDDGTVEERTDIAVQNDNTAVVTKEISVADYLCEGYHDCKFDDLIAKFIKPVFEPNQNVSSNKYISDLFDDAVSDGFLVPYETMNIFYVKVEPKYLIQSLVNYNREEMAELISVVNKINKAANEAIKSKIKRGKISIV